MSQFMSDVYLWSAAFKAKASQNTLHRHTEKQLIPPERDEDDCLTQMVTEAERCWFTDQTCVFSEVVKPHWTSEHEEGQIKISSKSALQVTSEKSFQSWI